MYETHGLHDCSQLEKFLLNKQLLQKNVESRQNCLLMNQWIEICHAC